LALSSADQVVIGRTYFEMVWLLRHATNVNGRGRQVVTLILNCNLLRIPMVQAGLEAIGAGADFADGRDRFRGTLLGGGTFVSFDKKAVAALASRGSQAAGVSMEGGAMCHQRARMWPQSRHACRNSSGV